MNMLYNHNTLWYSKRKVMKGGYDMLKLPHNVDFGNFVKELRIDMNMSSQQFADLVGLSRVTISNIENANIDPGRYALEKIGNGVGKDYYYMRRVYKKFVKKYIS